MSQNPFDPSRFDLRNASAELRARVAQVEAGGVEGVLRHRSSCARRSGVRGVSAYASAAFIARSSRGRSGPIGAYTISVMPCSASPAALRRSSSAVPVNVMAPSPAFM